MNKIDCTIRLERKEERREIENMVRESFWNVYRPGCVEHYILHEMRNHSSFIPELNYVLEKDGKPIGQAAFARSAIKSDDGREIPTGTLGPICISPKFKRHGYGKTLLDFAVAKAAEYGIKALCLEGNIAFYGKSGFDYASKFGLRYHGLPDGADATFFLCKELESGYLADITGEYAPPDCYNFSEEKAEAFDKTFPEKQKLKLAGQIF